MFRKKSPQRSLFEVSNLLPAEKLRRLEGSWARAFADRALPLIDEQLFGDLYDPDTGRPNKPVQTVVGILLLKDMFDLTDEESLGALEYDLRWQVALVLTPEEAHCCQKTLHNFRAALLAHGRGRLVFEQVTGRILAEMGIDAVRQRLDSTHITSNMARLSRLGLFCETIRVFLRDLRREAPGRFAAVPESWRRRYLKDDGGDTRFHDARTTEARRRLSVAARDLWRLTDRFRGGDGGDGGDGGGGLPESFALLERLLGEQCDIAAEPAAPPADEADFGQGATPATPKEPGAVNSDSMQSPHDPDATYGHKGKGYEAQVCETLGNGDKPEMITYVQVTPSCGSDATEVVPAMDDLDGRGLRPTELVADTTFTSTENVIRCAAEGTELVGPVGGPKAVKPEAVAAAVRVCAAADAVAGDPGATEPTKAVDAPASAAAAAALPAASPNPEPTPVMAAAQAAAATGGEPWTFDPKATRPVLEERRRFEATPDFRERYAPRAGIEATNSELKRAHGLGRLRVRGADRVKLAVYLKALACNVKRMVVYLAAAARRAAGAVRASVDVAEWGWAAITSDPGVRRTAA